MDAKEARAARMAKMKKPEPVIVKQIGDYDMSALRGFTITSVPGTSTYILTHGRQCAKIKIRDILYIESLRKCNHRGSFTLNRLIEFADQNNLDMELEDVSTLEEYGIDLALLKIAQTGNTWYGKYGFQNGLERHEVEDFIRLPYKDSTYQVKAIEWADRLKAGDESVVDDLKELCQHVADFLKDLPYTIHRRLRPVKEVVMDGKIYFRKLHVYPAVETWNQLYPALLDLGYPAVTHEGYDYFPKIGNPVKRSKDPLSICKSAQDKLNRLGYESIELTPEQCNITNAREYNGDYYPIDMLKIVPKKPTSDMEDFLDGIFGGKRRTKKLKCSKRRSRRK